MDGKAAIAAAGMFLLSCALLRGGESGPGAPDPQGESLTRLRASSASPVKVLFEGAVLRFASFDVPADPTAGTDPVRRAEAFLEQHADLLSLAAPRESLLPVRVVSDPSGEHVFFEQRIGGVPVYAGEIAVHLRGDRVVMANGAYLVNPLPAPQEGRITADHALAIARAH